MKVMFAQFMAAVVVNLVGSAISDTFLAGAITGIIALSIVRAIGESHRSAA